MKRNRIVLLVLLLVFTAVVAGCTSTGGQQAASETPSKADTSGEDTQIEGTSPSDVLEVYMKQKMKMERNIELLEPL